MGFIERLRQQKEGEQAVAAAKAAEAERDRTARYQADQERAREERKETELRMARKNSAETCFNVSGVEQLVLSLSRLVNPGGSDRNIAGADRRYTGRLDVPCYQQIPTIRDNYLPPVTLAANPDSVSYGIVWNVKAGHDRKSKSWTDTETERSTYIDQMIGHPSSSISQYRTIHIGYTAYWHEYVANFIAVEIQPIGDIVFHSRADQRIPQNQWFFHLPLQQQSPLEAALERAYGDPRVERYNAGYSVRRETLGSSRWS